jgi:hypothetical protein
MSDKEKKKINIKEVIKKRSAALGRFLLHWAYLFVLIVVTVYSALTWYYNIYQSDWNEEQKKEYISEQSKFSFDKTSFDKITNMAKDKRQYFSTPTNFEGRDIFYPDGF